MISGNLLPCALVLLLLNADIRKIVKMGPKLVLSMLGCSLTVVIGFILTYLLLKKVLPEDSWMTLGAISGAWIGGSENMVAAAQILGLPDNNMTYCLLMDTVVYGIWISILFAMVNKADWFNKWTKADTSMVENAIKQIEEEHNDTTIIPLWETLAVLAVAFGVGSLSQYVAKFLPVTTILNASGWSVLIATTIGIILAMTPLGKLRAVTLGQVCMYVIMGNIASWTDFLALKDAPFLSPGRFVGHGLPWNLPNFDVQDFQIWTFLRRMLPLPQTGVASVLLLSWLALLTPHWFPSEFLWVY